MNLLKLGSNIAHPDDFYADLIAAHEGLSTEQSDALNARLILVLANHVGDISLLREALAVAAAGRDGDGHA